MRLATVCAWVVFATGCGSAPAAATGDFPSQALMTMTSMSGALNVEVRTSPQPPSRGLSNAQFRFTDANGATVSDLSLDVLPWMPIMGHGTSFPPKWSQTAAGQFEIDDIYFSMPGLWSLRTTISTSGGTTTSGDYVEPSFDIP